MYKSLQEFFNIALHEFPFWVSIIIATGTGMYVVNLLWKRREKRILTNMKVLILKEHEDKSDKDNLFAPDDVEEALKALLKSRKEEYDRLNMLENYRRDYIGNVAHELKTPIFAIQGYIESIQDDPEMPKETLDNFLDKANKNTERLARIVSDLDTITKYESGFLRLEYEEFDLVELLREVTEGLEIQAAANSIFLQEAISLGNYKVWADKFRIRQVLTNLATNSLKYGKTGGYTKFRLSNTGEKVIIEVADNGIGIPKNELGRIFERFYRVEKSRNRESGGSGLGLSICKHIVEAHGEQINVLSTEGAGSVFSFAIKSIQPK
jgi:two-component system, OmpR family, phosphate regulon sensor histidine kinase PhoR